MAVAEQLTRRSARALALGKGLLAVDNDRTVTLGMLDAPPLFTGEVVRDLAHPVGLDAETVEVVHHDIRRKTFAQHPTVAEARRMRRQRRHAVMRFLERDPLLVAHQPSEKIGRESATGEELGMRTAVGDARESILRGVIDLGHEL